jgi:hypothetical protein
MHLRHSSGTNILRYSELVCSAVRLGVSLDDIMAETRRYHGREFSNNVEKVVKSMIRLM